MSRHMRTRLLGLVLSVLFLFTGLAGCISHMKKSGGPPPQVQSAEPPDTFQTKQRLQELDAEIAREERNVSDHRSLINMTFLDLWKIEQGGPSSSRGGISQNGPVDVEHEIIRLQNDIAAIEKDITIRKRRIASMTNEKAHILDQETRACFPGDTLVLTDEGLLKPIRLVTPGDRVMTFDIGSQTDIPKPVLATYQSENNHYYVINHAVRTTAFERLLTENGWKEAIHLKVGDKVFTDQGLTTIHTLDIKKEVQTVHNLQVQDAHTFYVFHSGDKRYLVHNTGGGSEGGRNK
ncbi:MAG: polymorphic toxin-type HINT domain-containing protein [Desulfobacterales bacterium]|nr:polymorphic toxin-type HINT domain-containing protein [Desulfobacterales bacterium]MDX2513265.1 polymorphic toxin-type HINT domain-containing protein [Desulfobacterales bacterium]